MSDRKLIEEAKEEAAEQESGDVGDGSYCADLLRKLAAALEDAEKRAEATEEEAERASAAEHDAEAELTQLRAILPEPKALDEALSLIYTLVEAYLTLLQRHERLLAVGEIRPEEGA